MSELFIPSFTYENRPDLYVNRQSYPHLHRYTGGKFNSVRRWHPAAICGSFVLLGAVLLLVQSCQPVTPPIVVGSTAGQLASNYEAGNVNADLTTISHSADALAPTATPPQKPLVTTIQQSASHATTQIAAIQQSIVETKKETDIQLVNAVKVQKTTDDDVLAKQIATDNAVKEKAVTGAKEETRRLANSPLCWAFGILAFVCVCGMGFGIYLDLTAATLGLKGVGKAVAIVCPLVAAASIGVIFTVQIMGLLVVPIGIAIISVVFAGAGVLIYTLIRERGILSTAIEDQAKDSLGSKQPTVPYTKPTENVIKKIVSPAAANPVESTAPAVNVVVTPSA